MWKQLVKESVINVLAPVAILVTIASVIFMAQGLFKDEAVNISENGYEALDDNNFQDENSRIPASEIGDLIVDSFNNDIEGSTSEPGGSDGYSDVLFESKNNIASASTSNNNSRSPSSRIRTADSGSPRKSKNSQNKPDDASDSKETDTSDNRADESIADSLVDENDNTDPLAPAVATGEGDDSLDVIDSGSADAPIDGGAASGGGTLSNTVTVSVNKASGYYSANPSVIISIIGGPNLSYDLSLGACSAPATTYSLPVSVGPGDGVYCLSIEGNDGVGNTSGIQQFTYTVDSTLPDNNPVASVTHLQTSEMFSFDMTSTTSGDSGIFYTLYNLPSDPGATACDVIEAAPPLGSIVMDIDNDGFGEQLEMVSIPGPLNLNYIALSDVGGELRYGDNYFMSLLEDRNPLDASKYSCPTSNIVLNDFFIQDITTSGGGHPVNLNGQRVLSGGFTNYGAFRNPAFTGHSGDGKSTQGGTSILESGIINIIN